MAIIVLGIIAYILVDLRTGLRKKQEIIEIESINENNNVIETSNKEERFNTNRKFLVTTEVDLFPNYTDKSRDLITLED